MSGLGCGSIKVSRIFRKQGDLNPSNNEIQEHRLPSDAGSHAMGYQG
jgi:hypothetical protein